MTTCIDHCSILNNWPPKSFESRYQENFYHTRVYLESQPEPPKFSFFLTLPENKQTLAAIHFYRQGKHAISQLYAPFGSVASDLLSKEMASYFLASILNSLSMRDIDQVSISHPAPCYNFHPIWEELLMEFGFSRQSTINHHLQVDDTPLREKLHHMEKRKLARCSGFGFSIRPNDRLYEIYEFILSCRIQKDQKLSLSYERLEQVVNRAGGNFLLCAVFSGRTLAAASIVIKVNPGCWYQFYPAHSQQFDKQSPLVFLLSELYQYAKHRGVQIIDLGTSELHGQPLKGLLNFKNRLGGITTSKTIYSKSLKN